MIEDYRIQLLAKKRRWQLARKRARWTCEWVLRRLLGVCQENKRRVGR